MAYRANYASTSAYRAGSQAPSVVGCDGATSDVYFSGTLLSEAFENTTSLFTNGSGVYCTTAQEDSATLEALLRGAIANLTDFSRIIIMRTASDFDRPYAGEVCTFRASSSYPYDSSSARQPSGGGWLFPSFRDVLAFCIEEVMLTQNVPRLLSSISFTPIKVDSNRQ